MTDPLPRSVAPRGQDGQEIGLWSDAALDKMLAFAHAADDGSEASRAWIDALRAEMTKRAQVKTP